MKPAHNRVDMIGKTYNSWAVLSHSDTLGKIAYYNCKCLEPNCGNVYRVDGRNVRNGSSKRCVPCGLLSTRTEQTGVRKSKKSIEEARVQYLMNTKKKGAKKRGLDWGLTLAQFKDLIFQNCYYSGLPPSTTVNVFKNQSLSPQLEAAGFITYNGIDRLDSAKGYVLGNVVPCSEACNRAKMEMTEQGFYNFIKIVSEHLKKQGKI